MSTPIGQVLAHALIPVAATTVGGVVATILTTALVGVYVALAVLLIVAVLRVLRSHLDGHC